MRVGIATDHGGFGLKEELLRKLRKAGHKVIDFGAHAMDPADDYPDFVVPLAQAVVAGKVERGVAICGSGVGASVCANKVRGIRAALVHDHFSARQGVEDDHMNILCMGGRTVGPEVAWDLVQTFLDAKFSKAERHLRRLGKVGSLEANSQTTSSPAVAGRGPILPEGKDKFPAESRGLRLEKMGDLLHDFRNPAIAAAGFSKKGKKMLQQGLFPLQAEKIYKWLDLINKETCRIQDLALALHGAGKEKVIDLTERLKKRVLVNREAIREMNPRRSKLRDIMRLG